jgi:hypothetical protein
MLMMPVHRADPLYYGLLVTSPQNPWQQGPNPPQFAAGHPQQPPTGYPQQAQAGYPHQFAPGYPQHFAGAKPPPPGTVNFAAVVGLVVPPLSAVLSIISFVVLLNAFGWYLHAVLSILASDAFFTLAAVVCAVLWVVFSLMMRAGRGWARIVLVVLAGLWLLYDLYSIISFLGVVSPSYAAVVTPAMIIGIFQMFLVLVTTVLFMILVFLKPSNDYFKAMSAR